MLNNIKSQKIVAGKFGNIRLFSYLCTILINTRIYGSTKSKTQFR